MMEDERNKLFDEVWETPISTLAKKYGISDTALRKKCIKLEIPLPPMGYWAKVQAGKDVVRKPDLPPMSTDIKQNDNEKMQEKIFVEDKDFKNWCDRICVCKRVNEYNPLVKDYQNEIIYREKRDKEHQFHEVFKYSFSLDIQQSRLKIPYRNNKPVLAIDVSINQVMRASNIIDTFIRCVKELNGRVSVDIGGEDNTRVDIFDTSFLIKLSEIKIKRRSINSEKKNSIRPMYEPLASGLFKIEILEVVRRGREGDKVEKGREIEETMEKALEKHIGQIFMVMHEMAYHSNQRKRALEQENQLKLDEERKRKELKEANEKRIKLAEERRKRKEDLINNTEKQIDQWEKYKGLQRYIDELREYSKVLDTSDAKMLDIYIDLLKEKAKAENPVRKIIDEIRYINKDSLLLED